MPDEPIDQPGASPADSAATTEVSSPDASAAKTADTSAAPIKEVAASGDPNDEIRRLDGELSENLLKARTEDDEQPEPKPEPVKVEPEVEAAEDETVEVDPLAEQTGPRTLDDLKKQFPRAQTVALEEIAKVEAKQWALQKKVDEIGGTVGIKIAKEVMPALLHANPGENEANTAFQVLTDTNPALALGMSRQLLDHALDEHAVDPASGLPTYMQTGNYLIKKHLDPDYDVEKIEKLIKYDKAGLIDHEELEKEAALYAGDSAQVKALKERLSAIEEKDKATQAATEDAARAKARESYDKAVGYVSKQVMDAVIPIAEHFGWTATQEEVTSKDPAVKQLAKGKIVMGKMLTAYMNTRMKQLPEWASVDHLGKTGQAFSEDGQVRHLFTSNSTPLTTKLVAEFKEMVRILNPTFAKSFGSTRAAELKKQTRSGEAEVQIPPVKKVETNGKGDGFNAAIAELDAQLDKDMRQVRAG